MWCRACRLTVDGPSFNHEECVKWEFWTVGLLWLPVAVAVSERQWRYGLRLQEPPWW